MLQTVLHVLAQQLGVLAKNVELRGVAGIIPVGKPTDNVQTVAVSEFVVDTGVRIQSLFKYLSIHQYSYL